jgi:hypothetical protein
MGVAISTQRWRFRRRSLRTASRPFRAAVALDQPSALRETNERAIADRHDQDPDGAARYRQRLSSFWTDSRATLRSDTHLRGDDPLVQQIVDG